MRFRSLFLVLCCGILAAGIAHGEPLAFRWATEVSQAKAYEANAFQGETFTLDVALRQYGQPLTAAATARFYWQTQKMAADEWYATEAKWDAATGRASVDFTPQMDVGASGYRFFLGVTTTQGVIWRAYGTLRLKPSPGFVPGEQVPETVVGKVEEALAAARKLIESEAATRKQADDTLSASVATLRTDLTAGLATKQDKGNYLTKETDPTVPDWAKAATKPVYAWGEITGKPTTWAWDAISGKPTTWAWSAITGKPSTFAPSAHTHTKSQITDFPTTWAWSAISGKPATFAPSAHTHPIAQITGLQAALNTLETTLHGKTSAADLAAEVSRAKAAEAALAKQHADDQAANASALQAANAAAGDAQGKAADALTRASAAESAATSAKQDALAAKTSAAKADEALTTANAAKTSAQQAAAKAETAQANAAEALNASTTAAEKAAQAQSVAANAQSVATQAQATAQAAQSSAAQSATAAEAAQAQATKATTQVASAIEGVETALDRAQAALESVGEAVNVATNAAAQVTQKANASEVLHLRPPRLGYNQTISNAQTTGGRTEYALEIDGPFTSYTAEENTIDYRPTLLFPSVTVDGGHYPGITFRLYNKSSSMAPTKSAYLYSTISSLMFKSANNAPRAVAFADQLAGYSPKLTGGNNIAITNNVVSLSFPAHTPIAIGDNAKGYEGNEILIGHNTKADAGGVAIGDSAWSEGLSGSIAIGVDSNARGEGSIAIGQNAIAYEDCEIQLCTANAMIRQSPTKGFFIGDKTYWPDDDEQGLTAAKLKKLIAIDPAPISSVSMVTNSVTYVWVWDPKAGCHALTKNGEAPNYED